MIRYKGARRDGIATTGTVSLADLAGFAKARYEWGWRWMEARLDGRLVAAIEKIDGKRCWWAETDA